MDHHNEPRCGFCEHLYTHNFSGVWRISGCLTSYVDGNKHYLRWCCYQAYVSGNEFWETYEIRKDLRAKHPYPKMQKILLINNQKFTVYEKKQKPDKETFKSANKTYTIERSILFNVCNQEHKILTNSEYKKLQHAKKNYVDIKPACVDDPMGASESHSIYLLIEREFINANQPIYKIGKTTQRNFARFNNYPKGSEVLLYLSCTNCHAAEKAIIEHFKNAYHWETQIGNEYFRGDYRSMMRDICEFMINN